MPFTCVSLTCVHQKGPFCRVASEIRWRLPSLDTYYLQRQTFFFFFSYFSSLSFDITLAPHSGNFIVTQEGDQETPPTKRWHFQAWWWLYTNLSTNATQSRLLSLCSSPEWNKVALSESMGKFKQIHEVKIVCSVFVSLKPSPPPPPRQHVFHTFCPHISAMGSQEMCIL